LVQKPSLKSDWNRLSSTCVRVRVGVRVGVRARARARA